MMHSIIAAVQAKQQRTEKPKPKKFPAFDPDNFGHSRGAARSTVAPLSFVAETYGWTEIFASFGRQVVLVDDCHIPHIFKQLKRKRK